MNIYENLKKNEEQSGKNYKPRGGVEVRPMLYSKGLLNSCQIFHWDALNAKRSSPKKHWYGLCENAWFPWQPLIRFSIMGVKSKNSIVTRILHILVH